MLEVSQVGDASSIHKRLHIFFYLKQENMAKDILLLDILFHFHPCAIDKLKAFGGGLEHRCLALKGNTSKPFSVRNEGVFHRAIARKVFP